MVVIATFLFCTQNQGEQKGRNDLNNSSLQIENNKDRMAEESAENIENTDAESVCGNDQCEDDETIFICPQDCPQTDRRITELNPNSSDVDSCTDSNGDIYPVVGGINIEATDYARWFVWNNCAKEKIFVLPYNSTSVSLILYAYGDDCAGCQCQYPNFKVYENYAGVWTRVASIDKNESTQKVYSYFYNPHSNNIKIEADSCFYLQVFKGKETALKENFSSWELLPINTEN